MRLRHTLRIQALLQLLPAFDFENLAYAFAFEKSVVMDVPVVDSNTAELSTRYPSETVDVLTAYFYRTLSQNTTNNMNL